MCWLTLSSFCKETGSRLEGFISLLLKDRFSTLHLVSQPPQPGPAPCPLSLHICKSLKLSGMDHTDRAGLCQSSDSQPGLNLNRLKTVTEHQGRTEFTAPDQQPQSLHQITAQYHRQGTSLYPTEGVFFESTGEERQCSQQSHGPDNTNDLTKAQRVVQTDYTNACLHLMTLAFKQ